MTFPILSKRLLLPIICLFLSISTVFGQEDFSDPQKKLPVDPNVKIGKLENGLTYYIRKNDKPEDRMELRLVVNAGSILENDNQQGLAHFMEHMNFNGTKHFAKNDIVNYLQSIGVKFGADLNAYTGFDQTVFILPVPTDDPDIVDKSFQILEDWAHNALLEKEEIDKERGVVLEEWRIGRGASQRLMEQYLPVLLKDSRYAKRIPIGKKEILENFKPETLRDFYETWYRPDLMAVVAVGDLDVEQTEDKIKTYFGKIEMPEDPKKREYYDIPDHKETLVSIATDKESAFTSLQVIHKLDAEPMETLGDYRKHLLYSLFTGMLNVRLNELSQQVEPPFIFAATGYSPLIARDKYAYSAFANVQPNNIEQALKTLVTENTRVKQHGFTESELERYKADLLASYERAYNERNKTESSGYVNEYINNYLEGEPIPGIEFEYNYVKHIIDDIKIDEINALTDRLLTKENRVIIVTAPEKEGMQLPDKGKLLEIVDSAEQQELMPYRDKVANAELLNEIPEPGSITKEEDIPGTDITKLELSNGVNVYLKSTNFKDDEILMSAYSEGGTSLYPMDKYYSASFSDGIFRECGFGALSSIDIQKLLSGKNANANTYIGQYSEGISASSSPKDLETMFKLVYLKMTSPRKDTEIFASFISKNKAIYENLMSNPNYYFLDKTISFMSGNNPRAGGFPKPEDWQKIDLDEAQKVYEDRFKNAGDFFFTFVGNFSRSQIKPLIEQYIASIPTQNEAEKATDLGIRPPKGAKQLDVYKGSDPKSNVRIQFHGKYDYDRKTNFDLNALADLLDIKLVEMLREEKSGVYGVGAKFSGAKIPYEHYSFTISFPCSPDNVDDLIAATYDEIHVIKNEGASDVDLNKIKEAKIREMEVNLKKNQYWLNAIRNYVIYDYDLSGIEDYKSKIESLTSEDIKKAANKYLNESEVATMILWPENKKNNK